MPDCIKNYMSAPHYFEYACRAKDTYMHTYKSPSILFESYQICMFRPCASKECGVCPRDEIYESNDTLLFAAHNNFLLAMHMWVQTHPRPKPHKQRKQRKFSFLSSSLVLKQC